MANKNLIRRMRQLLILVLILAMTMSFATMTAMADNNISAAIKVGKDFEKGEEVTLIFHIAEDNDVRILATSKGAYLKFDMPTEFFSSNGIKTGDQISFETSFNRSGVITVGEHEGNDGGSENEGSIDSGKNNYEGKVEWYIPTPETGSLTVTKTVAGEKPDTNKEFTFTVSLTNADGAAVTGTFGGVEFGTDGKAAFTLKHGGNKTISGLPAGTSYTVEETADADYTSTPVNAAGTIEADEIAVAAFTNTKKVMPDDPGESGNGGNGNGGTVTPLPPDQNLEDPDTPNTPAEPVEPSEKPLPDDKHTVTEVPKTGDAVVNELLFNLLLLSISALAGMLFYLRRKTTNR